MVLNNTIAFSGAPALVQATVNEIDTNKWNHIACVRSRESGTVRGYIDGVNVGQLVSDTIRYGFDRKGSCR